MPACSIHIVSVDDYIAHLSHALNTTIFEDVNVDEIIRVLVEKHERGQPVSLIDIYGALLAQKLLCSDPYSVDLASQRIYVEQGTIPLPIYTSITGNEDVPYCWIEYSPYEVGGYDLNAYIPTWSFGRKFDYGTSQDYAPSQPLYCALGIWGSGMSANVQEFYRDVIVPRTEHMLTLLKDDIEAVVRSHESLDVAEDLLDYRVSPAQVFNWTLNAPHARLTSIELLTLIDAGIDFNIPVPPLLNRQRDIDIIIILDASNGTLGNELYKAESYTRRHNLKFPPINYALIQQPCSVHCDPADATTPIVIYMPLVHNPGYQNGWDPRSASYTATYNFTYSQQEVYQLTGLTRYTMQSSAPIIRATIEQWISQKRTHKKVMM